ncbi:MAG: (5-formylfuran-3-yl)methyl phosphate synthase [Halobacteriota archaeon]|nr:(5-formylfuran-3-yl)methyl phosphate synthase [Halobacteriota archaeon]
MRLLVSPINVKEARAAVDGGADIIDVKNPKEGSLGANFPWMIRSIKDAIGDETLSATLGDLNYKPGTASLAALGAAVAGAEYIKVGLWVKTADEALDMVKNVVRSVKEFDSEKKVVAASYSDYKRLGLVSPFELPGIGKKAGADVVMVDTGRKDGKTTFDFLSEDELMKFLTDARESGLQTAIAGSIGFKEIEALKRIDPDIIGVRGIVCGGDRNSSIKEGLVKDLKSKLQS